MVCALSGNKRMNDSPSEAGSILGKLSAEARDTSSEAMRTLAEKRWSKPKNELTIEKGWYWSAGNTYGWTGAGHSVEGVGINKTALIQNDELIVHVKSKSGSKLSFKVDTLAAVEFIKRYHSFKTIGTTKVGFIPRTLMTEI